MRVPDGAQPLHGDRQLDRGELHVQIRDAEGHVDDSLDARGIDAVHDRVAER
jgi:hypothetical protein